jgi:hypothetical protein
MLRINARADALAVRDFHGLPEKHWINARLTPEYSSGRNRCARSVSRHRADPEMGAHHGTATVARRSRRRNATLCSVLCVPAAVLLIITEYEQRTKYGDILNDLLAPARASHRRMARVSIGRLVCWKNPEGIVASHGE